MKKWMTTTLLLLMIAGGLGLLLYPTVSNLLAEANQSTAIQHYIEASGEISLERKAAELANAAAYNAALTGALVTDPFAQAGNSGNLEYNSILNIDGIMGYIEIPKIHVRLPIYHGTGDDVLSHAVGHLPDSALPVGGPSTHSVLTGHRGLPSAKLFTDLDKMEEGDTFSLYVMGDELRYQVNSIQIVEPWNTEPLQIFPGKDYVTLLTCHPYGINSHRMLILGERVELPPQEEADGPIQGEPAEETPPWLTYAALAGGGVGAVAILGLLLGLRKRKLRIKASRKWMDEL